MNKWLEEYNRKIRIPSITEKITYIKSILEFPLPYLQPDLAYYRLLQDNQ